MILCKDFDENTHHLNEYKANHLRNNLWAKAGQNVVLTWCKKCDRRWIQIQNVFQQSIKCIWIAPVLALRYDTWFTKDHTVSPATIYENYLSLLPSCRASLPLSWNSQCLPMEGWPSWVDLGGWSEFSHNVNWWSPIPVLTEPSVEQPHA